MELYLHLGGKRNSFPLSVPISFSHRWRLENPSQRWPSNGGIHSHAEYSDIFFFMFLLSPIATDGNPIVWKRYCYIALGKRSMKILV